MMIEGIAAGFEDVIRYAKVVTVSLRQDFMTSTLLRDLVHPHIVRTKLGRDRGTRTCCSGENLCPLPGSRSQAGNICELEIECCCSISSNNTNYHPILQRPGPVRVQFASNGSRLTRRTEVTSSLAKRILVDSDQSL